MARKDWFYIPLPLEQAEALDSIVKKEGKKYGILDRTQMIRIIIGEFIESYERQNKDLVKTRRLLRGENHPKIENHNNNNNNNNQG